MAVWVSIVLGLLVILLAYLFSKRYTRESSVTPIRGGSTGTGICSNPSCWRCQSGRFDKELLLNRLEDHLLSLESSHGNIRKREIRCLVTDAITNSLDNQEEIQRRTRILSGYDDNNGGLDSVMIWSVPGITRQPFWTGSDNLVLQEVVSVLQSRDVLEGLKNEYAEIDSDESLWSLNQTPKGKWRIATLVNQGGFVDATCDKCPVAFNLINRLIKCTMIGNCFGYAMYSCLTSGNICYTDSAKPGHTDGSSDIELDHTTGSCNNRIIEPHTGSCNYRIRCHIPLIAPKGFHLHVGRDSIEWKEGEVIMFDDSLIHSVSATGSGISRVVFIVDVWHPEIDRDIQIALNSVFSSL